jgi:hypothetical protein
MRKTIKGVLVLLALVAGWMAIVASGKLPRPTAAQEAALAALAPEPANVAGEHDAFAALALFEYDIPDAELDAVAKADAAAYEAWKKAPQPRDSFASTAAAKYQHLPNASTTDADLCQVWAPECLARVRKNAAAAREKVAKFAAAIEKFERFDRYDFYHYAYEPLFDSPIGATMGGAYGLTLTAAALDFADGRTDAAFARVCRNAQTWRRLRSHADVLVVDMIGVAYLSGAARLYAEMLAEQPPEFAAPCPATFAPLSDAEVDQCSTYRFEFLTFRNTIKGALFGPGGVGGGTASPLPAPVLRALFNDRHAVATVAEAVGPYCMQPHRDRVARREATPLLPPDWTPCSTTDQVFDPLGCSFLGIATPAYDDYYKRVLDLDARLKLVASVVWLRGQPAGTDAAASFTARPAALQSPAQPTTIDAAAGVVRLVPLNKAKGDTWEIPYRRAAAAAG